MDDGHKIVAKTLEADGMEDVDAEWLPAEERDELPDLESIVIRGCGCSTQALESLRSALSMVTLQLAKRNPECYGPFSFELKVTVTDGTLVL
ncbi:hypothetical protein ACWDTP_19275 [Mycobacterium sp. NPDC003449]